MCIVQEGALKVSFAEEYEGNPNILVSRFVLSIKDTETDSPICKARFVV